MVQAAVSFVDVCLFGIGLYIFKRLIDSWRHSPLPPGPAGWPVIGNLFQVPFEKTWEALAALGKTYGHISSLSSLGKCYVVLNSSEAISGVLEKQSSKCSSRPHSTMASELVGFNNGILFMDDNDRFRQYRKLFNHSFGNRDITAALNPTEEEETRKFLCSVLQKPEDLVDHICICSPSVAIVLKTIYGYTVQEGRDPFIELARKLVTIVSLVEAPGAFLLNVIPALRYIPKWLPGMRFLKDAKKHNQFLADSILKPHRYVLDQMAAGTAIPSFSSTLLDGGVVSAIHAFFLAMVLFPEVQTKAQAELDEVLGSGRLPSINDRDFLPYVNAVCQEVLRWHSVTPIAMPHVATEDIYYDGFLIPKGSWIIGNAWAVLHDESTYPDPRVFRPERFLGESPQPPPQKVCFGFGRRYVIRSHLAEESLFITVAMSLAVLAISKEVVDGVQVTPKADVTSGLVSHPKPFRCQITARSLAAEALLRG
ncbi:cytochrome P450 [Boletus edulis]|nr:cytochrome P450 [Boletus edulis]